jgi:hypothetical protein
VFGDVYAVRFAMDGRVPLPYRPAFDEALGANIIRGTSCSEN